MKETNDKKSLEELELIVKQHLQQIADVIENMLPNNFGFVLLTYAHNQKGQMMYVSNSQREDVVKNMKEFIDKTENNYGNDTGKY